MTETVRYPSGQLVETLAELVAKRSGLHLRSIDRAQLEKIARGRAGADGLKSYVATVRGGERPNELDVLAGKVTVNESYFFRDRGQFDLLEHTLLPELVRKSGGLKIWSAGCSGGEEPYSLAAVAISLVAAPAQVQVIGTDIDSEAIGKAREGRYGQWSFRDLAPHRRERFFVREGESWVVRDEVREVVTFKEVNLAAHGLAALSPASSLDAILCRNVFIYMNRDVVSRILHVMATLLKPGGFLMTGHSELFDQAPDAFESEWHEGSMVYRRRAEPSGPSIPRVTPAAQPARDSLEFPKPATGSSGAGDEQEAPDSVAAARATADAGRIPEAREALIRLLDSTPDSADALVLLGQVEEACGDSNAAVSAYRRCIYVAPEYAPAYLELAMLYGSTGRQHLANPLYRTALGILDRWPDSDPVVSGDDRTAGEWVRQLRVIVGGG